MSGSGARVEPSHGMDTTAIDALLTGVALPAVLAILITAVAALQGAILYSQPGWRSAMDRWLSGVPEPIRPHFAFAATIAVPIVPELVLATAAYRWFQSAGALAVITAGLLLAGIMLVVSRPVGPRPWEGRRLRRSLRQQADAVRGLRVFLVSDRLPMGPTPTGGLSQVISVGDLLTSDGLLMPQTWNRNRSAAQDMSGDVAREIVTSLTDGGDRVALLGPPGAGKSLTATRVHLALLDSYLASSHTRPVPVHVSLSELRVSRAGGDEAGIEALLPTALPARFGLSAARLAQIIENGKALVILDGLDEVPAVRRTDRPVLQVIRPLLLAGNLLTSRTDYWDSARSVIALRERYRTVLELTPGSYGEHVLEFVHAYCGRFAIDSQPIESALRESADLRELSQRPLLLWMIVDVLADQPPPGAAGRRREAWTQTSVYVEYTEKWLFREAARTDSILSWEDKEILVRLVARTLFLRGSPTEGGVRAAVEKAIERPVLAAQLGSEDAGPLVRSLVQSHGLDALVDEICSRTFLVRRHTVGSASGYGFIHKSFLEFYVARDLWIELIDPASDLRSVEAMFAVPLPDAVVFFFRQMLSASVQQGGQGPLVASLRRLLMRPPDGTVATQTIRQHAGNFLPLVANPATADELDRLADSEPDVFVRRGIIVGLAMHQGRTARLEKFVRSLDVDEEARAVHLGYVRIYHGDQRFAGVWRDDGTPEAAATISAQVDRLAHPEQRDWNQKIEPLTIYTIRALLSGGRGWDVLDEEPRLRDQLSEAITARRHAATVAVRYQATRLQELLEEPSRAGEVLTH